MTPLCRLAQKYGTDKFGHYTRLYHAILGSGRLRARKVLEIGIGSPEAMIHVPNYSPGASLRMWEEYFPFADIYGLDNNEKLLVNEGRIQSRLCNQASVKQLEEAMAWAGDGFDLIVDDGSHAPDHQAGTAKRLLEFVKPGGIYIIEDVNELFAVSAALPFEHAVVEYKFSPPDAIGRAIVVFKD